MRPLNFKAPFVKHLYLVLMSIAMCCHVSCLACLLLVLLVLVRFLCRCRVLSSAGVITCFVFLLLFPFVVPERGLLFLSPSFKKPRFVGRLAFCSVRSTQWSPSEVLGHLTFYAILQCSKRMGAA